MSYTYAELNGKTVAQLREIAKEIEHDALEGHSRLHKDRLIMVLCEALGIEAHEHHEVVGIDKSAVKVRIRELRVERDSALETRDLDGARAARHEIKKLKRRLRRAWK